MHGEGHNKIINSTTAAIESAHIKVPTEDEDHDDCWSLGEDGSSDPRQRRNQTDNHRNGTEHLVRDETRAVRFLRLALILLLVTVASLTGVFTHRNEVNAQLSTFMRDFDDASIRFNQSFHTNIGALLFQCYYLSVAMSEGVNIIGSSPKFPYVSIADLDGITASLRYQTRVFDVMWSPLLETREDKSSWEAYAEHVSTTAPNAVQPLCNVCEEGYEIVDPRANVTLPGNQATFSCADIDYAGKAGMITPTDCGLMKNLVNRPCGCKKTNTPIPAETGIWNISNGMFRIDNDGKAVPDQGPPPYSPVWQIAPSATEKEVIMFNQMSDASRRHGIQLMVKNSLPVMSAAKDADTDDFYNLLQSNVSGIVTALFYPVYDATKEKIVGSLGVDFSWKTFLGLDVPIRSDGVVIVLDNTCGQSYSYTVVEGEIEYLGEGD